MTSANEIVWNECRPNRPNSCARPQTDQAGEHEDVEVRRQREDAARLLDAAQVRERDQRDRRETQQHAFVRQRMQRGDRRDRAHARAHRHRDGEDVVDEQRRARDHRRARAEVLAADDVRAAAARIREDRLAVRRDDDREQHRDDDRDRNELREPEGQARSADRDDEQDLLRRVRGRRDGVGGEDRERDRLDDALVFLLGGRQGATHEHAFEAVEHRRPVHARRCPGASMPSPAPRTPYPVSRHRPPTP